MRHPCTAIQAPPFSGILLGWNFEAAPEWGSRERRRGGCRGDQKNGILLPVGDVPPAKPGLVSGLVDLGWDTACVAFTFLSQQGSHLDSSAELDLGFLQSCPVNLGGVSGFSLGAWHDEVFRGALVALPEVADRPEVSAS